MRRDTQGRGCTRIGSPMVINYGVLRKSGSYALKVTGIAPEDPMHVPKARVRNLKARDICHKWAMIVGNASKCE